MKSIRDNQGQQRLRSIMFGFGDCLFLLLVSTVAIVVMHLIHQLGWNFALTWLAGMAVAMVSQTLLALSVAPILGSIESMTPSMVVAMMSPMMVCTLNLTGYHLSRSGCFGLGAAFGVGMFLFIETYGCVYKRSLRRAFPGR